MGWDCLAYKSYWLRNHFLLAARSDHTTGSRNIKPELVFKEQKIAWYALFCLIIDLFKGGSACFLPDYGPPGRVRVRVSFTTGQYGRPSKQQLGFLSHLVVHAQAVNRATLRISRLTDRIATDGNEFVSAERFKIHSLRTSIFWAERRLSCMIVSMAQMPVKLFFSRQAFDNFSLTSRAYNK